MAVRKYASDYRLDRHLLPNGKEETVRIYQGPRYSYCGSPEQIIRLRKRILLGAVLVMVCLLPLLFNNTQIGRTIYVLLPMAFAFLPWYLLAIAGWRLGKFPQPMTREEKDQTDVRLRRSALWLLILLGLTAGGSASYCVLAGCRQNEWLSVAGIWAALLVSVYLFTQRKKACTQEVSQ